MAVPVQGKHAVINILLGQYFQAQLNGDQASAAAAIAAVKVIVDAINTATSSATNANITYLQV